ncbi:hypothetical protein ILUMI_19108 [Ignelater luminosus]|uniref:Uncharacterized protein n=1 Tax=Ignelater luminosus TaxID=2038154 RepID=A0A8K0CNR6_IGNLU|nr:hypothetical protein ILUMI_19108 [Ignelater luminosus]
MPRNLRNLTRDECVQAVVLVEEGWNYRRIAERFGVAHTSVPRMLQRFGETGSHLRRPGAGRNRATTLVQDRFSRLSVLR